jgi:hypothetical protein
MLQQMRSMPSTHRKNFRAAATAFPHAAYRESRHAIGRLEAERGNGGRGINLRWGCSRAPLPISSFGSTYFTLQDNCYTIAFSSYFLSFFKELP